MRLFGGSGALLVAGREAARLGSWKATGDSAGGGWAVEAAVTWIDAFWLLHAGAVMLRLDAGQREWRWRDVAIGVLETELKLTGLGEPEGRRYGAIQVRDAGDGAAGAQ